jgi:hypothetical protein
MVSKFAFACHSAFHFPCHSACTAIPSFTFTVRNVTIYIPIPLLPEAYYCEDARPTILANFTGWDQNSYTDGQTKRIKRGWRTKRIKRGCRNEMCNKSVCLMKASIYKKFFYFHGVWTLLFMIQKYLKNHNRKRPTCFLYH